MSVTAEDIGPRASEGGGDARLLPVQHLNSAAQREDSERRLRCAAAAGDSGAMLALGRHLLASPPPVSRSVVDEGRRLVFAAADAGNGEAAHLAALMSAIDNSIRNNFSTALDYLVRSAVAGHLPAQAELATLARDKHVASAIARNESLSPEIFGHMRSLIDVAAWRNAPKPKIVSSSPFIAVAENFISDDTCDWLIERARSKLGPARTYNSSPVSGEGALDGKSIARHSAAGPELDLVLLPVLQRIAALTGIAMNGMEPTSILHYAAGEEYQPHFDFLDPALPAFATKIAASGQRFVTVLIYLNDDFEGGETEFPKIGYRYKGRKGDALMFRNIDRFGAPDRMTLHAGLPPTRGEKWLFARACTRKTA
jgi:hypothetical protein